MSSLMAPLSLLVLAALFTFFGICLGIVTGLIPGIHVNTISILIVSSIGIITLFVSGLISNLNPTSSELLLLISMLVIGCLITHTFLNFIPATYFGAPEGETALSVLPAHRMLLEGRGFEAIKASAVGSFAATFIALLLILPARFVMGNPINLYEKIVPLIPLILFLVIFVLILQEGRSLLDYRPKLVAGGLFLLSGLLGFIVLTPTGIYTYNWTLVEQQDTTTTSVMLFPMFTGLFGISNLLVSLMDNPEIPEQRTEDVKIRLKNKSKFRGILSGTMSGGLVGWLPGITAAAATTFTQFFTPKEQSEEESSREFIMSVSAVDTACAIFTLVALFIILKARSGAMQAILKLNEDNIKEWSALFQAPDLFLLLLFAVVISASTAYLLTLSLGKSFAGIHKKLEYEKISKGIILFLIILMFVLSGPIGLLIGTISTAVGLIPPLYGVKRVHLMGCIIFPVILFFTGLNLYLIQLL
ncbi:MAG: tripartite tricarboxylate transporter permease [Candidatus Thermoplasmatota archaeon]|nr:tripartite tricarboxylate transporter permease [Candidatus Thermoplasmatota archaeon]